MLFFFLFFGVIIVVELLALVGLVFLLFWIARKQAQVDMLLAQLPGFASRTMAQLRSGKVSVDQVLSMMNRLRGFCPPWLRLAIGVSNRIISARA